MAFGNFRYFVYRKASSYPSALWERYLASEPGLDEEAKRFLFDMTELFSREEKD